MDLTLDRLIAELQIDLEKSAEDCEDKDEKKDKKEVKEETEEKKEFPAFMKKDKEDGEKSEKDEDKKDEGQEKSAAEMGAALAREVMEMISTKTLETPEMNKQAQVAGQALASALLENLQKKASSGDMTTTDGVAPGVVPNKNQVDNAAMEAEGAAAVKPMLTGDGVQNHGTINQIFDAIIADAMSQGAAAEDQVHDTGVAKQESAVEDHAVPNQVKVASEMEIQDEIEKAAAVSELVAQGVDFGDAVTLVKQAAAEIQYEMEKAAAMEQLMAEGVDFESAVELVKQASSGDMTTTDGVAPGVVPNKNQVDNAAMEAEGAASVKPMLTGDGVRNQGTINQIFDAIVSDAMSQGAASEEQVHDTGVAKQEGTVEDHAVPNQVKVAAINRMTRAGVDFDEAVEFVKMAGAQAVAEAIARKMGTVAGGVTGFTQAAGRGAAKAAKGAATGTANAARRAGAAVRDSDFAQNAMQYGEHVIKPHAQNAGTLLKGMVNPVGTYGKGAKGSEWTARAMSAKELAKNPVAQTVAGVGALGAGGAALAMHRNQEKKAAFDALVEAGVDFDQAAILVAQKAQEIYGD